MTRAPEDHPILTQSLAQDLAPHGGKGAPARSEGWRSVLERCGKEAPESRPHSLRVCPQPQIRLTTSEATAGSSFSVLSPKPESADPKPRPALPRRGTGSPGSCAAHLAGGPWGRCERAERAGRGAELLLLPPLRLLPSHGVGGARGAPVRRRWRHAERCVPCGGSLRTPICVSPGTARGSSCRSCYVSAAADRFGLPNSARHCAGHHGNGAPHGPARQCRGRARLPGARSRRAGHGLHVQRRPFREHPGRPGAQAGQQRRQR